MSRPEHPVPSSASNSSRSTVPRRTWLAASAAAAVAVSRNVVADESVQTEADASAKPVQEGRLQQGVCKWCFSDLSVKQLAQACQKIGLVGIDLLGPDDFPTLKKYGLVCSMVSSHSLTNGLCDPQYHETCLEKLNESIEAAAKAGYRNVICFSGNARGIGRKVGMKNCVDALKKIVPVAEEKGVVLNMELLNSRVNHPDYMCDKSEWGVELCKQVGSDHFKLLFDIYHMQIMEGDLIRTIERDHPYFGHYHTAGNPGRNELNDQQELFYPPIARAIADTGFDGYFSHEFIPTGDPITGLTDAATQCTV